MEALATALGKKRSRDEEDSTSFPYSLEREESPEAKRLREDLLDILDDDDGVVERNPTAVGELDSVLRSLEEEIGLSGSPATYGTEQGQQQVSPAQEGGWLPDEAQGHEVAGAAGSSRYQRQTELGFLLEASDDELGLPPSTSEEEGQQLEDETTSMFLPSSAAAAATDADDVQFPSVGQIWGFEDDMPSPYEGFGFGYPSGDGGQVVSGLLVSDGAVVGGDMGVDPEGVLFHGGLFDDFSDAGASSDLLWRPETLPAL